MLMYSKWCNIRLCIMHCVLKPIHNIGSCLCIETGEIEIYHDTFDACTISFLISFVCLMKATGPV